MGVTGEEEEEEGIGGRVMGRGRVGRIGWARIGGHTLLLGEGHPHPSGARGLSLPQTLPSFT